MKTWVESTVNYIKESFSKIFFNVYYFEPVILHIIVFLVSFKLVFEPWDTDSHSRYNPVMNCLKKIIIISLHMLFLACQDV